MRSLFGSRNGTSRAEGPSPQEIFSLARRYVVQETVGPLRVLAKSLALGIGGAAAFGLGVVIALLGVLRLLENETGQTFAGNWSFAPYLITAVLGVAVIAVSIVLGTRTQRDGAPR